MAAGRARWTSGNWTGSPRELTEADRERRYLVLASHHPLFCLTNPRLPAELAADRSARRVEHEELSLLLQGHPSLVLWLSGHVHRATVIPRGSWWEVAAPSLIDFPQQGRVIELLRSESGLLTIACTMFDHQGELPWRGGISGVLQLAGLSRELSANDWQRRTDDLSRQAWRGTAAERNVLLQLPDPFH